MEQPHARGGGGRVTPTDKLALLVRDINSLRMLRNRFAHMTEDEAAALDRAAEMLVRQRDLLDDTKYRTVKVLVLYGEGPRYEATSMMSTYGVVVSHAQASASLRNVLKVCEVPFAAAGHPLQEAVITARVPRPLPVDVEGHVE